MEIRNNEIYQELNTKSFRQKLEVTRKFFNHDVKTTELTEDIGLLNGENVPFRVRFKLITNLLTRQ